MTTRKHFSQDWRRYAVAASVSPCLFAAPLGLAPEAAAEDTRSKHSVNHTTTGSSPRELLVNGDFEKPALGNGYHMLNPADHPGIGWKTNAPKKGIEFWHNHQAPANTGDQLIELDSEATLDTVYQDVEVEPGTELVWSLAHRGRNSAETMRVLVGPPDGELKPVNPAGADGPDITDPTGAWKNHLGSFTVPEGMHTLRIGFEARTHGNLLDSVSLRAVGPAPTVQSSATDQVQRGDAVDQRTEIVNGEQPVDSAVYTVPLPAGTELVEGSVTVDDAPARERARVEGGRLVVALGEGATAKNGGSLAAGAKATVSYRLKVAAQADPDTVIKQRGSLAYRLADWPALGTRTVQGNETAVPLVKADLSVSGGTVTSPQEKGGRSGYTVQLRNDGPGTARDITLKATSTAPPNEARAHIDGGTCKVGTTGVECTVPELGVGEQRTLTVEGTGDPTPEPPTVTATVQARTADPAPADNTTAFRADSADLRVEIAPDTTEPHAGDRLTFTVKVTNSGPATARETRVVPTLPTGFTPEETKNGTWTPGDDDGHWDLGTLANGETRTFTVTGTVPSDRTEIDVQARVESATFDPATDDNTAAATVKVAAPGPGDGSASPAPEETRQPTTEPTGKTDPEPKDTEEKKDDKLALTGGGAGTAALTAGGVVTLAGGSWIAYALRRRGGSPLG
ncbi:CARDB domain-containing protein [Kitasatospora sp. NPDC101176]|uniref:CARDB domain-containing protein n=1 Tax=Kitasatospora sp. NPDC101176 TaxID=3364099 RepID=UPI00380F7AA2